MRNGMFVALVATVAFAAACGEVYDIEEPEGASPAATTDDGTVTPTPGPNDFTLTCVAPDGVALVTMKANVGGGWDPVASGSNGRATWVTQLDAERLAKGPCRADDVGKSCGYLFNCEFPGHVPGWGVTQDSGGNLRVAGDLTVSGPLPVIKTPVDNGIRGGNYWLHSP